MDCGIINSEVILMTMREQCVSLIKELPEEHLPYFTAFLRDVSRIYNKELEEVLDEAFCAALADRHEAREDKDAPGVPIEELAAKLGISLDEDDES
jgi:hypothetical protein